MLFLFLILLGCTVVIYSQPNANALLLKKKNTTVQKFFPEQFILFQTNDDYNLGKIEAISLQSISLQIITIKKEKSELGLNVRDTMLGATTVFLLKEISGIYVSKKQKHDGVYFTESSQDKTSIKSITAPKNEAFYETYWNTGEAGYLVTTAFHTLMGKKGKKKMKDMRKIGKKYRLVVL